MEVFLFINQIPPAASHLFFEVFRDLFLLLIGAGITLGTSLCLKHIEIKNVSLNNAQSIAFLLIKERASLHQIYWIIERVKRERHHQCAAIRGLFLGITLESIDKISQYKKLHDKKYFVFFQQVIQKILSTEQVYRDCYLLVEDYNKAVKQLLDFRAIQDPNPTAIAFREGYEKEVNSVFDTLEKKYNEAIKLNETSKAELDDLCSQVFGKKYTVIVTNGIVESAAS